MQELTKLPYLSRYLPWRQIYVFMLGKLRCSHIQRRHITEKQLERFVFEHSTENSVGWLNFWFFFIDFVFFFGAHFLQNLLLLHENIFLNITQKMIFSEIKHTPPLLHFLEYNNSVQLSYMNLTWKRSVVILMLTFQV